MKFVTIQSQANFHKIANYACINEHIFENLFGEKPHERSAKRIANAALNSY
jgi:hypothetical protein